MLIESPQPGEVFVLGGYTPDQVAGIFADDPATVSLAERLGAVLADRA